MKFYALLEIIEKGKTRALTAGASSCRENLGSRVREIFLVKSGILGFGIRNTAQRI